MMECATNGNPEMFMQQGIGICFVAAYLLFMLVILALMVLVFCKIFSKAGYSWAMGLIALIPGVGTLVVVLILAFSDWPVLKELRALRSVSRPTAPPEQPR